MTDKVEVPRYQFMKKPFFRNDIKRNFFQTLIVNALNATKTPNHIVFIVDGNRRWAKLKGLEGSIGHDTGFDKLIETFNWLLTTNVKEATYFCFSFSNFHRDKKEVDNLMMIFTSILELIISEIEEFMCRGIRVNIFGKIDRLPNGRLRCLCARTMLLTMHNNKRHLNLAFPYSSSFDLSNAAESIRRGVRDGLLLPTDIDENLIEQCLQTKSCQTPDLLVRTSGEVRFSNFMLWQLSFKFLYFCDVLWPDFSLNNLIFALFKYQFFANKCEERKEQTEEILKDLHSESIDEIQNDAQSLASKRYRIDRFLSIRKDEFVNELKREIETNIDTI